jgi:hypothetical protein
MLMRFDGTLVSIVPALFDDKLVLSIKSKEKLVSVTFDINSAERFAKEFEIYLAQLKQQRQENTIVR